MLPRSELVAGLSVLVLGACVGSGMPVAARAQTIASAQVDRKVAVEPKAVIELFTSQGCSSCPAADALLKTYAERPDVIALSLPVDYWDHLGWKDTLASPRYTARQKAYAKSLASGNVYTPQIVINGTVETVGSNRLEIDKAIQRTRLDAPDAASRRIAITGRVEGNKVTVDVGAASSGAAAASGTIWLALVEPRVDVEIKHGENRGRTLSYYNVVREMTEVGMWSGKPVTLELPQGAALRAGKKGAVLLQAGDTGHMVAASWIGQR